MTLQKEVQVKMNFGDCPKKALLYHHHFRVHHIRMVSHKHWTSAHFCGHVGSLSGKIPHSGTKQVVSESLRGKSSNDTKGFRCKNYDSRWSIWL